MQLGSLSRRLDNLVALPNQPNSNIRRHHRSPNPGMQLLTRNLPHPKHNLKCQRLLFRRYLPRQRDIVIHLKSNGTRSHNHSFSRTRIILLQNNSRLIRYFIRNCPIPLRRCPLNLLSSDARAHQPPRIASLLTRDDSHLNRYQATNNRQFPPTSK